jgi:hypothetical protein
MYTYTIIETHTDKIVREFDAENDEEAIKILEKFWNGGGAYDLYLGDRYISGTA